MTDEIDKPTALARTSALFEARPELADALRDTLRRRQAPATEAAHLSDLRIFRRWCAAQPVALPVPPPATPETVVAYVLDMATAEKALATILRHLASISWAHRRLGLSSPTRSEQVRVVVEGMVRDPKRKPQRRRSPITTEEARKIVAAIRSAGWSMAETTRATAIVTLGLATSLRCDDLSRLDVSDVKEKPFGLQLAIRRSKTDQAGVGRTVDVLSLPGEPHDPVSALIEWRKVPGLERGPLFRRMFRGSRRVHPGRLSPSSIGRIVAEVSMLAGLKGDFGGHSLRAGFVTQARRAGVDWAEIMGQTGHKRLETVMKYDRTGAEQPARVDMLRKTFQREEK